jgi:hypothetical protein
MDPSTILFQLPMATFSLFYLGRSWYEQSSKSSCPANGLYRRICPYTPTLDWDTLLTTFRTHSVPDVKAVKQGRV